LTADEEDVTPLYRNLSDKKNITKKRCIETLMINKILKNAVYKSK